MKTTTKKLIAILVIPILFICFLFYDIHNVEKTSEICNQVTIKVEQYKSANGEYPDNLKAINLNEKTQTLCSYQKSNGGYIYVLSGKIPTLQWYVYNSNSNTWHWD